MVREIAQLVGGETKYSSIFKCITCIGNEEGISGFFAGLIPNLIADYITIWGISVIRYTANSIINYMVIYFLYLFFIRQKVCF